MARLAALAFDEARGHEVYWDEATRVDSFAEILRESERCAVHFEGLAPGSICALVGFAPREVWVLMLAAWSLDVCVLPFAELATSESIDLALNQLPWSRQLIRSQVESGRECGISIHDRSSFEDNPIPAPDPHCDVFIMTSGSTGIPKAIGHTLESLTASAEASLEFYGWQPRDRWLMSLDPSHIGGLQILIRTWIGRGVCCYRGAPKHVDAALQAEAFDFLSLVPTQLFRALESPAAERNLAAARAILLGGAETQASLLDKLRSLSLPVSITYGASEAASQISAFPPGIYPAEPGAVGLILPIWTIRSLKEQGLSIEGPALMRGFWQALCWQPQHGKPYALGDRGFLKGRCLTLVGRRDQIFQVGGENLAPAEILNRLADRYPLGDLIVIPREDPRFGQAPWLIIRSRERPDAEGLLAAFEGLPPIKRPREIWWMLSADVTKLARMPIERALDSGDPDYQRIWSYGTI